MADKLYVEIGADIKALQASLNDATKELQDFRKDTEKGFEKAAKSTRGLQDQLGNTAKATDLLNKHTAGLGTGWLKVAKSARVGGAAMKSALIASGIGALLVALTEIVENWDEIKGAIDGSTKALREHKREMIGISAELKRQAGLQDDNARFIQNETELAVHKAKIRKASEEEIYKIEQDGRKRLLEANKESIKAFSEIVENGTKYDQKTIDAAIKAQAAAIQEGSNINLEIKRAEYKELERLANLPAAPKALVEQQQWVKDALVNHRDEVFTLTEDIQEAMTIRPMISEEQIAWAENLVWMTDALENFAMDAKAIISGSIAGAFSDLGTVIGEALVTGGNVMSAIGQSLLDSLGMFLSDMGEMLIQYGTMAIMKGVLDKAIAAGGVTAIAAGVAAIGVGIALKAISGAMGARAENSTSGGGGGSSVSGGVSGSGSRSYASSSASSGSSSSGGTYVFEISGDKLIGVLKNTLNRNKALGGSNLTFG